MTIWSNASGLVRSSAELGLTRVEQQRQLLNKNNITSAFMTEKDARSKELADTNLQIADKLMKKVGIVHAKKAAALDVWMAGFTILQTAGSGKGSFVDVLNSVGDFVSKILELQKVDAEEDAVNKELGKLDKQAMQMDKGTAALLSNPYI